MSHHIDVIATTISGSIKDWGKIKRIVPLFTGHGLTDVRLVSVDSHAEARRQTADIVASGGTIVISAGGSGTFNAVLEGCFDAGRDLSGVRLGFLRKGSADLIGKVLEMPDEIEQAIAVFVRAIRHDTVVPCDVLRAVSADGDAPPRRFVGYGGAEIFGRIPHYTENRFIKYYKGVFSQLFGDLGPFFVGTSLSVGEKVLARVFKKRRHWDIRIDGHDVADGRYQAMIIVNGDLGPDLPFARSEPLGSGKFYLFAVRDLGAFKLPGQLRRAWNASILEDPKRWGFESFTIEKDLVLTPRGGGDFPVNVDGSTMRCRSSVQMEICDRIHLLSAR